MMGHEREREEREGNAVCCLEQWEVKGGKLEPFLWQMETTGIPTLGERYFGRVLCLRRENLTLSALPFLCLCPPLFAMVHVVSRMSRMTSSLFFRDVQKGFFTLFTFTSGKFVACQLLIYDLQRRAKKLQPKRSKNRSPRSLHNFLYEF